MQKKGDRDYRSRMHARSYPHAGEDTTEIFGIRNCGISEREKFTHDI